MRALHKMGEGPFRLSFFPPFPFLPPRRRRRRKRQGNFRKEAKERKYVATVLKFSFPISLLRYYEIRLLLNYLLRFQSIHLADPRAEKTAVLRTGRNLQPQQLYADAASSSCVKETNS